MQSGKKILVIIHVYYIDQLDLIIQSLKNISLPYDLYVTIGAQDKQMVIDKLSAIKPDCHFVDVKNVGYDVWPFVKIINELDLSQYSYLIKLHTKRDMPGTAPIPLGNGFFVGPGSVWRDDLYEFIRTPEILQKCIDALDNGVVGMCCRYNVKHEMANHSGVIDMARESYPDYICGLRDYAFVAGTMFICRIEPIQLLKDMNIKEDLFAESDADHTMQFAHVIERTIGECVYKLGMIIDDPFTSKRHIEQIKRLYKKEKWVKRIANYLCFPIFIAKYRRKLKRKLHDNYIKKLIKN